MYGVLQITGDKISEKLFISAIIISHNTILDYYHTHTSLPFFKGETVVWKSVGTMRIFCISGCTLILRVSKIFERQWKLNFKMT